ncbi:MAG: class II aldolase/adducin family protein [Rhodospirillaceae bacterium]
MGVTRIGLRGGDADEGGVRARVSDSEWQLRCELAAAHWLVAHFCFVDMTYNHVSVRLPENPDHFLVKADNVFMEQVTASNVVKYDVDGNQVMDSDFKASPAAYNVHAAILKTRPDIAAVVHTHSPANLAVSAQRDGLLPLTQQAMRFYERIAYYENTVDDTTRAGTDEMARAMGDRWVMILENHGALVAGQSLPEAYIYHHFFELACRAQIGALSGGRELIVPAPEVCRARAAKFGRVGVYDSSSRDWVASMALVEKHYPEYRD